VVRTHILDQLTPAQIDHMTEKILYAAPANPKKCGRGALPLQA
jgi:hypothetical protein